jgi:hypothetical protein
VQEAGDGQHSRFLRSPRPLDILQVEDHDDSRTLIISQDAETCCSGCQMYHLQALKENKL